MSGHEPEQALLESILVFLSHWTVLFVDLDCDWLSFITVVRSAQDQNRGCQPDAQDGVVFRDCNPPVFAFSLTIGAFDLLMSLDPMWYSTIFGVYYFCRMRGGWTSHRLQLVVLFLT